MFFALGRFGSWVFMLHAALDIVRSLPLLGYIKCMN